MSVKSKVVAERGRGTRGTRGTRGNRLPGGNYACRKPLLRFCNTESRGAYASHVPHREWYCEGAEGPTLRWREEEERRRAEEQRKRIAADVATTLIRQYQYQYQTNPYNGYPSVQETNQQPHDYLSRVRPPERHPSTGAPVKDMYRERRNWRHPHHYPSCERGGRPYHRRRSHLDDIYLPNHDDDDLADIDDIEFRYHERYPRPYERRSNYSYSRRQYFRVIPTNTNIPKSSATASEPNAANSNVKSESADHPKRGDTDKENIAEEKNSVNTSDVSKSGEVLESAIVSVERSDNNKCHETKVNNKTETTEIKTNHDNEINTNTPTDSVGEILPGAKSESATPSEPFQEVNKDTSEPPQQETPPKKSSLENEKSKVSPDEEATRLPSSFPVWDQETARSSPQPEMDSDQETVYYDDFISIENIDTTKSYLESSDHFLDDYSTVDMDIDSPSPAKRKIEEYCDGSPTKKKKFDHLYHEINSHELLNKINAVLNEDKGKGDAKYDRNVKRHRSKSLNSEKRIVQSICRTTRSKSVDSTKESCSVRCDLDLKANLLFLLDNRRNLQSSPKDSLENILKTFKDSKSKDDIKIAMDENSSSISQHNDEQKNSPKTPERSTSRNEESPEISNKNHDASDTQSINISKISTESQSSRMEDADTNINEPYKTQSSVPEENNTNIDEISNKTVSPKQIENISTSEDSSRQETIKNVEKVNSSKFETLSIDDLKPLLVVDSKSKNNANLKPSENDVLERENGINHPQMPVEPSTSSIHDSKPLLFVHGKDKSNANLKPSENCALEQENGAKQPQMPVEPSTSSIYDLQPLLVVDSKGKSNDDLKPSENDVLERENGTKQPQMPVEPSTYSIHYLQPLLVVDSKGKSNANLKPSENCVLERENRTKQPQMPAEPSTSLIHDLNLKPLLVVHSKGKSNANLKPSENDVLERENGTNHPQMPVEPSTSSIHDLKPLLVVHNKGKINANSKPSENDVLERENGTKQPQMPAESSISSIHDLTPLLVVNSKDKMNANLKPCRGGVLERENGEKRPQVPLKPFVSFEHPLDPNRPLTLGEYKKIQDISRKFPPPRIDLGIDGFGPDKTYKKRRTNYSPMNKLHLKKTDTPSGKLKPAVCPARRNISETAGKEKVGTWPAQKFSTQQTEGSIMANKRQCKTQVTAGQHKGIFRPVPQSSMDEYRRNFPPVAESHKHDKPGTSKTESNVNTNRTTLHKDKIVSIGARRASVPNFSVASIGSESSTLSKKLKKSISHIDPVSRPKEDTKIDPVDRKDRNVGDKTCVKAIAPKSQNKESKDMKAMKKPKDNPRDNNKFFNNKFIKLGNKPKENSVRSSKVAHGAMKIHEKKLTDSNETKKSENLKETNEKPDTLKINVTNATDACGKKISCIPENVALQPQLILNRIDDKIPISVARKRPITFASISEFVFIRCEVLLQERFPMRQKARSLPVDEECCDKAVLLDSPDVQRSTTFVRPTTMPPGVEIETTDDIIEVKPQIPIVDLTDDDVEVKKELSASPKVEDLEKEAKSDVLLKDTVIVPVQETITLYRSEETLNNSLELQATVASISSSLGVSGNTKHKMETDRVSQNEKGTNGFIPASSIVNSLVTIQDVNATVPTQTPAVTSNPSLPLLPTTCNTAVSSPRSSKSILNELANVVDAVTTRRKEPQRSEGTASIVHSVGTFLPPVYHALSQGQANAQHVRSTIIYVPPKPDAAKITRTDRNTDGVFAMPPPPYPALSKPTPRLQQEVIQRPVVDDNDHHTPMVIPTAPRSAESSSIASNKPQGPAITVTDRGGFAGGRIGDSNTNHLTPVQNARRDSNALLVTQNPQPFGSDIVKVSQVSAAQSLPCSSGGATQAGNPSTSANPPVLTPWPPTIEIPEIGKHLSRFICIYMALRRAQLQYVADFIKISKFVPDAGKTILRDFDVWTSNKVHDVLKRMSASLCGLNFSKIPVTAYSASLVIQCALESLKEAVPSITKSALYLMLDALMSPEMEQYNLVPFLRTFCVFVRDVANQMRMNANDGNSSQQQRQNLPQEPLLPAQRQLLLSQIQQYNVIIARQTIMTAPEQEVRNSIARMMQSQRQQTVNVRPSMPMQPQFASHTVGNKPPSGNLADTANQRTRERNQIRAQKAKPPRSVFQSPSSNSQNPEMLRRSCCETSHAILSNMLTNSCEPSGQVPPALPSNQAIPGKDVARPEALEERFKIHLPYTVPYEVPTSSATSIATCNNASAAAMAAASFVATAAAATAAASAVANAAAATAAASAVATAAAQRSTVAHAVIQNVPQTVEPKSTPNVPMASTSPSLKPICQPAGSCASGNASEPSTSKRDEPVVEGPAVKEDPDAAKAPEVQIETIDLTWMDDIDPEQLQSEIEFITLKKEEPTDEKSQEDASLNQELLTVVPSPADSGIGSPPTSVEYSEQVFLDRTCICGQSAEYVCGCKLAMYCSGACQSLDWKVHKTLCLKTISKNSKKDGAQNPEENANNQN